MGTPQYETFKGVLSSGGVSRKVAGDWEKVANENWLTEGTGIPVRPGPVTTTTETALYRAMEPMYRTAAGLSKWDAVDFDGMAAAWNALIFRAYTVGGSGEGEAADYATYLGVQYKTAELKMKDSGHFASAAKESFRAIETANAKGGSQAARKAFDAAADAARQPPADSQMAVSTKKRRARPGGLTAPSSPPTQRNHCCLLRCRRG